MSIEEQLKSLILSRYRSVKAFAEAAGVPNSTVASMLERGVKKATVGNVLTICKFLGISADGLGDGKIVSREQLELTPAEVELIKTYRQLDERGQRNVEDTAKREFEYTKPFEQDSKVASLTG